MVEINLLSCCREKPHTKYSYLKISQIIFFGIVGVVLLLWHMGLEQKNSVALKQINNLQQELEVLSKQDQSGSRLKKREQRMGADVINLEKKRYRLVKVIKAMQVGVMRNLSLTEVIIKNDAIKITGQTRSISDLERLMVKIIESKCGNEPVIQKVNRKLDGYSFVLSG
ncbi:MAG: hypothetical protein KKE11_04810 [Gammaproteobacteria bacterium]|nr:hypothetical protein [Gammaproteobacteria bacterium]